MFLHETAGTSEATDGLPVVLVVVVGTRVDVGTVEVEVVSVVIIVSGRGPIVAVAAAIVGARTVVVPRVNEVPHTQIEQFVVTNAPWNIGTNLYKPLWIAREDTLRFYKSTGYKRCRLLKEGDALPIDQTSPITIIS